MDCIITTVIIFGFYTFYTFTYDPMTLLVRCRPALRLWLIQLLVGLWAKGSVEDRNVDCVLLFR